MKTLIVLSTLLMSLQSFASSLMETQIWTCNMSLPNQQLSLGEMTLTEQLWKSRDGQFATRLDYIFSAPVAKAILQLYGKELTYIHSDGLGGEQSDLSFPAQTLGMLKGNFSRVRNLRYIGEVNSRFDFYTEDRISFTPINDKESKVNYAITDLALDPAAVNQFVKFYHDKFQLDLNTSTFNLQKAELQGVCHLN